MRVLGTGELCECCQGPGRSAAGLLVRSWEYSFVEVIESGAVGVEGVRGRAPSMPAARQVPFSFSRGVSLLLRVREAEPSHLHSQPTCDGPADSPEEKQREGELGRKPDQEVFPDLRMMKRTEDTDRRTVGAEGGRAKQRDSWKRGNVTLG